MLFSNCCFFMKSNETLLSFNNKKKKPFRFKIDLNRFLMNKAIQEEELDIICEMV